MDIEAIARVCHGANRALCQAQGDYTQQDWDDAEQWQRDSAIAGVQSFLADPTITPEDQHELWRAHKIKDGWKYGPAKDPEKREHPCMVAYDQLPPEQRIKDELFQAICRALAN